MIKALARLQTFAGQLSDVQTLLKVAKASGLDFSADEVTNAKIVGNKIHFIGPDSEDNREWLLCTFFMNKAGTKGDFGGAPDASFKSKAQALKALEKINS